MNMSEGKHLNAQELRGTLTVRAPMHRHTSWRAGGVAAGLYQPVDLADLQVFMHKLPQDAPLYVVGLGSNLLVRDGGLRGTVLLMHAALNEMRLEAGGMIYAQAGIPGAKLARYAAKHDLRGGEFFAGIPGTVGGMLAMNAGCYGGETWNVVQRVQTMDRQGVLHERMPEEYEIAYRHVKRKVEHADIPGELFVGAWLKLQPGDGETSRQEIRELLGKRIATQPLNMPNAGSVFRNRPGDHAARLIESCGLKGKTIGGAQVSLKHANFIVNLGEATAKDIESLIFEVQAEVKQKTGVELHPEVRIVGEA